MSKHVGVITARTILSILLLSSLSAQLTEQKITASDGSSGAMFGKSVSISGDYAIVGAGEGWYSYGAAYIYVHDGESWLQQASLPPDPNFSSAGFGASVSIDGDLCIVGVPGSYDQIGSAYIYRRTGVTWAQEARLIASDGESEDRFGISVTIDGDYAVVGASYVDSTVNDVGAAYVFHKVENTWIQQQVLYAGDMNVGEEFGCSVDMDGDRICVGAWRDNASGYASGAAYVFIQDQGVWAQQGKLTANGAVYNTFLGMQVSISGNHVIAGATGVGSTDAGAAFIFSYNGASWTQLQQIYNPDPSSYDSFGSAVSITNDYALVGAHRDDLASPNTGSAYLFVREGNSWVQQEHLSATDAAEEDQFGLSVALGDENLIIGATHDDDNGEDSGSAYLYSGFTPIGVLSVTPEYLDFGSLLIGESGSEQLTISNTGTDTLTVDSLVFADVVTGVFSSDTSGFSLEPGESLDVQISYSPLDPIDYDGTLVVFSTVGNALIDLTGSIPRPIIESVVDIPDDQGGWLALNLTSEFMWNEIDMYYVLSYNQQADWIVLDSIQPTQDDIYSFEVSTLEDSTAMGIPWYFYQILAKSSDPLTFYPSLIDSGYSVDNIPPPVPGGFNAHITEENKIGLIWESSSAVDFDSFEIYRSEPDDQSTYSILVTTVDTSYVDTSFEFDRTYYYMVFCRDIHDNLSGNSEPISILIVCTGQANQTPQEFDLAQNHPNPFNPTTTISYDLPIVSDLILMVYDITGREITTIVDSRQPIGSYSIQWDGTDNSGNPVSTGVYFCRLVVGATTDGGVPYSKTIKMVLLR